MKCKTCPLYKWHCVSYEYDESEPYCLAQEYLYQFPDNVDYEDGGCKRTNKWILSQDPKKLHKKLWNNEAEAISKWCDEIEKKTLEDNE